MAHPMQHHGKRKCLYCEEAIRVAPELLGCTRHYPWVNGVAPTRAGKPIAKQWWSINGQVMFDAMVRCHKGEDPELMYLELIANSEITDIEETT